MPVTTPARIAATAVLAASALLLTACTGAGAGSGEPTPSGGSAGGSDAFPVSIDTHFGAINIEKKPQRVVALGWGDAEAALALGVQPVGASDWLAFGGDGVGPWAEGLYTTSPTIIGTMEPSYEAIAALDPDIILDVKSSGDEERYKQLSAIAPTVGIPEDGENYLATVEEQTTMIAAALGLPDEGLNLLADLEMRFDDAAEANPAFEGKTATVAAYSSEGWGAYVGASERLQFVSKLGFTPNPAVEALATDDFFVPVSTEQLNLLDSDLLIAFPIYVDASEISAQAAFTRLPVVKDGHSIVFDDADISAAYSLGSVLSQRYAIDKVVPMIADAVG